jgi:hypothetical protein
MSSKIRLTQGKYAIVDKRDFPMLSKHTWCYNGRYAITSFYIGNRKSKLVPMHRLLLRLTDPKILVDHINRDKLDNRRYNLRTGDKCINSINREKRKGTMSEKSGSKYKGVVFDNRKHRVKRYQARLKYYGKIHYSPYMHTERDAAIEYNKLAIMIHGEYACLNKVS